MKESPILFSTEMVRAILDGRKTMTRRIEKKPERLDGLMLLGEEPEWCPYGGIGDLLWVKETFRIPEFHEYDAPIQPEYKAGHECASELKWKPSIFMPKEYARIWLKIDGIRFERLQDITDEDAIKEGVDRTNTSIPGYATERFKMLWNSINEKRGFGWDVNPWVWVIEFERTEKP